jgi:type II secretory pathway component PulK
VDGGYPDHRPRPGGAEAAQYAAAGSPFRPANRPLATVDELRHIRGVSDAVAAHVAPYVTVWSDGTIDVNAAPEPVLAALPGVGGDLARAFVAHRAATGLFRSFGEATSFLASGGTSGVGLVGVRATTVPTRLLIVSRGWETGRPLTREVQAVIELRGLGTSRTPQLVLRHWTERDR